MITALSGGGLGDIVYSIPILRDLGVNKLYIKEGLYHPPHGNMFTAMRRLVVNEGFECEPYPWCEKYTYPIPVHFDMDTFRKQPKRGVNHIQLSMRNQFKLPIKPYEPWLHIDPVEITPFSTYSLIFLSPRWRANSPVDWKKILHSIKGPVKFIGFQDDWISFCSQFGNCEWWPTNDIYDMAQLIAGCDALYCNQSVALTLAQGLGKTYFLERKPNKTNTLLFIPTENLL